MKPIRLSDRAVLQVAFRGCSESEVIEAIRTIPWTDAELGRQQCRKDFAYRRERNGVRYRSKQVHPVFVEAPHEIVVVAVDVCYFREACAHYEVSKLPREPAPHRDTGTRIYTAHPRILTGASEKAGRSPVAATRREESPGSAGQGAG